MTRSFVFALAATTALASPAMAAGQAQRIRGTIEAVNASGIVVQTPQGKVDVALTDATKYVNVVKSSLSNVAPGSFIGTAAKGSGSFLVALEVVVFPASMRGSGEGHYDWDPLTDTTLAGGTQVASSMTNGTVETASSPPASQVHTTMTNGNIQSASDQDGAKRITVTYDGGKQTILVPPTAPIVTFEPADHTAAMTGAHVFIRLSQDDSKVTANLVAVGKDGLTPPM